MAKPTVIFPSQPARQAIIDRNTKVIAPRAKLAPPPAPLWTSTPDPPDGDQGVFYAYNLSVHLNTTRGVTIFLIAGALPDGLIISGLEITGVPTGSGTSSNIQLRAVNTSGSDDSAPFDIVIAAFNVDASQITGTNVAGSDVGPIEFTITPEDPPPPPPIGDFFVAKTGSDANPGTELLPKLTIQEGVKLLSAGETLIVKEGVYLEQVNLNSSTFASGGGTFATATRIIANPGDSVEIKRTSGGQCLRIYQDRRWFIIDGINCDGDNNTGATDCMKIEDSCSFFRITNLRCHHARRQGILSVAKFSNGSEGFAEFLNVECDENGTDATLDHGMYITTENSKIHRCHVHHNFANGFQLFEVTDVTNVDFQYNVAHHNGIGGVTGSGLTHWGSNGIIANNIMYSNLRTGIGLSSARANNMQVFSNTCWDNQELGGLYFSTSSFSNVFRNNIMFENPGGDLINNGTNNVGITNLQTDPLFVDSSIADFHILPGSDAIGAGTAQPEVIDDFDLVIRGDPPDIGAYENVP